MSKLNKIPKRYQPKGFEILHEDRDVIVGNKAPGFLTVAAKWNKDKTIHSALSDYVRKGNPRSNKAVYVVHRLDQGTSGVLIYAKSEEAKDFLKDNWKKTKKIYYAVVHGRLVQKEGIISSYLMEDEDYVVYSTNDPQRGKLSRTEYKVVKEVNNMSLVEINLLTGRKNQIRVHFADAGHPVVGDEKYRNGPTRFKRLALHAYSISFDHPFSKKRMTFEVPIPDYFKTLVGQW